MSRNLVLVYNYDGSIPPLGIAYLSSYVKKMMPEWTTHVICNRFENDPVAAIKRYNPDVVGFYTLTPGFNTRIMEPARELRQSYDGLMLMGGPHITSLPTLIPEEFDLGILGDAEATLVELLQAFEAHGRSIPPETLSGILGLTYRDRDNQVVQTGKRPLMSNLDDIPMPDYEQLKIFGYFPKRHREMPTKVFRGGTLTTSRGCPFTCSFCQESGEKANYHSVDRFIDEVRTLVEDYNVDFIDIMDDLFIYNRKRLKEMARRMEETGLNKKVQFFGYVRADHLTEENVQELKRMNFKSVFIGFESNSPEVLSFLKNKKSDCSENQRAIDLCHKYDILVYGSFIFGSPMETIEDMKMTFDFIRDNPMALIEWQILTPLPGTKVWNMAVEKGIIDPDNIDFDNLLLRDTFDPLKPWMNEQMTKAEFDQFYEQVMKPVFWSYSQRANHFEWRDLLNPALWKLVASEPRFYASVLKQTMNFKRDHGYIDVPAKGLASV